MSFPGMFSIVTERSVRVLFFSSFECVESSWPVSFGAVLTQTSRSVCRCAHAPTVAPLRWTWETRAKTRDRPWEPPLRRRMYTTSPERPPARPGRGRPYFIQYRILLGVFHEFKTRAATSSSSPMKNEVSYVVNDCVYQLVTVKFREKITELFESHRRIINKWYVLCHLSSEK